ncbi:MAG: TonB family protein [Nitrospirae bacterium]|nr:TonB family protein [Nitrospirota bacterium]
MAIGYSASLISPHQWAEVPPQGGQFKRVLASSFLLHLVFFSLLLTIQVAPTFKENVPAYQVALVSLSDLTSSSVAVPQKTSSVPSPPPINHTMEKESLPSPVSPTPSKPFQPNSERLSETFAGAVGTIAVPQDRTVNRVLPQGQSFDAPERPSHMQRDSQFTPTPIAKSPTAVENGKISPQLPEAPLLAAIEPSMNQSPSELTTPTEPKLTKSFQEMVQSIEIPSSPSRTTTMEEPKQLSPRGVESTRSPNQKGVAESLKEVMKSVVVPASRSETIHQEPKVSVGPKRKPFVRSAKSLTESLKEVLSKVVVPNVTTTKRKPVVSNQVQETLVPPTPVIPKNQNVLKDVIMPPKAPDLANLKSSSPPSSPMERQAKPSQLNQQIAKLMVPEVQAPEQGPSLLETVNAKIQGASTDLRVTGGIQEGNPYWGLVQQKVDKEWLAFQVEAHAGQPIQVIIGFRLQRTGHVQGITVEQSSGRAFFDLEAKRTVLAADPLPPFPADMKEAYYDLQFKFTVRKETP